MDELERIAREVLGIDTLAERGRDSLDFHEVSVVGLRKALEAAKALGRAERHAEAIAPLREWAERHQGSRA